MNNSIVLSKLNEKGKKMICPVAVFIDSDNKVLIGLRKYSNEQFPLWTLPGGRCVAGETIEQALKREVYEEIEISKFEVLDYLGDVPGSNPGDVVVVFVVTTTQEYKNCEPEKFIEWKWQSTKDIPSNFINNDVLTLINRYLSK